MCLVEGFTKVAKMVTIFMPPLSPVFTSTTSLLYSNIVAENSLKPALFLSSTFVTNTGDVGVVKWNTTSLNDCYLTFSKTSNWTVGGNIQPFSISYQSIDNTPLNLVSTWGDGYYILQPGIITLNTMTSGTSTTQIVTSSGADKKPAWNLFNNTFTDTSSWESPAGSFSFNYPTTLTSFDTATGLSGSTNYGPWFKIEFNEAKSFNSYRIGYYGTDLRYSPTQWIIYGSNNNITYTNIENRTKINPITNSNTNFDNDIFMFSSIHSYRYMVFQVKQLNFGGVTVDTSVMTEFQLLLIETPILTTPILTGNSSNLSFKVSASSIDSVGFEPYRLFDNDPNTTWGSIANSFTKTTPPYVATSSYVFNIGGGVTINSSWVKISLNQPKQFNYYRLGQNANALVNPVDFGLYGSNNDTSWVLLNQQTGYNLTGTNGSWMSDIYLGTQEYQFIALVITKVSGNIGEVDIRAMEIGMKPFPLM